MRLRLSKRLIKLEEPKTAKDRGYWLKVKFKNKVCLLRGFLYLIRTCTINFLREINCVLLNSAMTNNKKIYSLVICFDETTEEVEWVQETIQREEELPDNIYETREIEELENYLEDLPDIIEIGEA